MEDVGKIWKNSNIFIPVKRNRVRKKFCFVRFEEGRNAYRALLRLRGIKLVGFPLEMNMEKFSKDLKTNNLVSKNTEGRIKSQSLIGKDEIIVKGALNEEMEHDLENYVWGIFKK